MRCRIIISADDFGMSGDINRAIVLAFEQDLISNTSVMANMPGFAGACELAARHELGGWVGLHLNLSEGWPLSQPIRRHPRFCDASGAFRRRRTIALLSRAEARAVECELEAQIEACLGRGLRPAHLNSHHHFHTEWPIGSIVMRLARRHGIVSVRMTRNCGARLGFVRGLYKLAYNRRLRACGLTKVRYFGAVDDVLRVAVSVTGTCEVSVHPGLDAAGLLVDRLTGEALQSVARRLRSVGVLEVSPRSVIAAAPKKGIGASAGRAVAALP